MPSNDKFSMEILVGDAAIPEYNKKEFVYVESNLYTPVSYQQSVCDKVNGEEEKQVSGS